jgi:DNA-binding MarR family transcriptional regulator
LTIEKLDRSAAIDRAVAGFETLMHRLAGSHAPEFLEIDVTMPQAKILYLLAAAGDLRMSDLVQRLGVSLSTVSGLVDRVVDHGLAARREDASDRRHVVVSLTAAGEAFVDRFRELNARQLRDLLKLLDDDGLRQVGLALAALAEAAGRAIPDVAPATRSVAAIDSGLGTTPSDALASPRHAIPGKDPA